MRRLFVVPIEPLEERYSAQWLRWWKQYNRSAFHSFEVIQILPELTQYRTIENGQFLDNIKTNRFKLEQLQQLIFRIQRKELRDGDIIWFHDGWFPGVETLAYIRDTMNIKFQMVAMFHAGTYDKWDYLSQSNAAVWAAPMETGWCRGVYDKVLVATEFHKRLLCRERKISTEKVFVVPFPFMLEKEHQNWECDTREQTIVFPHRLACEKGTNALAHFHHLLSEFNKEHGTLWRMVITKQCCRTKAEYYAVLKEATYALSFAKQETWGIAMQEATVGGCIPIVPSRLSYKEMYPKLLQYRSGSNLIEDAENAFRLFRRFETKENEFRQAREASIKMSQCILHNGSVSFDIIMSLMAGDVSMGGYTYSWCSYDY